MERQIPKDYLELIKVLQKESEQCRMEERWPILSEEDFWKVLTSLQNSNIKSKEEMGLAAQFLNEAGFLLYFISSSFNGLDPLYFIDPQWLSQMLSKFITADSVSRFTRGGLISLKDAELALSFNDKKTSISFNHYVDLLESLDIALRLDDNKLLLPSKLPSIRPGLQLSVKPKSLLVEAGQLHRIYKMNHVPSGFWSRLLVQLVAAVCSRQGPTDFAQHKSNSSKGRCSLKLGSTRRTMTEERDYRVFGSLDKFSDPRITFWQEGIYMDCTDYHLLIESVDEYSLAMSSASEENDTSLKQGLIVTVTKTSGEEDSSDLLFLLATFAIDHIDSLICQWYPGLLDEGCLEQLIPCPYCLRKKKGSHEDSFQDVHMFSLIECAKVILESQSPMDLTIRCANCQSPQIQLRFLIPDLLVLDVPSHLHINSSELEFDPVLDVLGQGGEGTVFRGSYHGQAVAIKQNVFVQSCRNLVVSIRGGSVSDRNESFIIEPKDETADLITTDFFWKSKTLSAFNGFRQETCVLARLRHPYIISLLGIVAPSLSYVMELSPHGSLRRVLQKNQETITSSDREGKLLSNRLLVYKIIYQIVSGLQYLHSEGIVYKDLKPENILIWSLDVDDVVNIKLSDYGLARQLTKQGLMGIEGTAGYQAPEIRQKRPYNEKVDVFAFAMVMYELVTSEPCFHEVSPAAINKSIVQGKRPVNSGLKTVPSQMMLLIERCWAQNPNDRPTASEICNILQNFTFICKEMVISLEENRILGSLPFIYWDRNLGLHHPYLRFWTGNDSGRCYHVFNAAFGQFKVINQCHPGPKVTCMILINKVIVIGTENPTSLQVIGFAKETNQVGKLMDPMHTHDVPLLLIQNIKESSELFVGFANSEFHLYSLNMSSEEAMYCNLKLSIRLSDNNSHAIICGLLLNEGNELWVSCGPDIVVLNTASDQIRKETTIPIFSLLSGRHVINSMCSHSDQVWCLSRKNSIVVELDFESRSILCILECSQSNPLNKIISNFDWVETLKSDKACASEEELPSTALVGANPKPPTVGVFIPVIVDITRPLKAKFGKKPGMVHATATSYRRKLLTRGKTRLKEKHLQMAATANDYVRSMCFVKGALWVGRENGDILVINVTHNNPYYFEHGQVLAILHIENQDKHFSNEHLVNMNGDRVVAARTTRNVSTLRQSSQLAVWSALGLDSINQYRQIWKLNSNDGLSRMTKSVKSPSFFLPK